MEGVVDTGVPLAGHGAPLVSEFGLMELIAVLGRSPDSGRAYVGRVIECAWRLKSIYAAVITGRLAPWRALRIAELTHGLNADAAGFVDRQLFNASGCTWTQIERLVTEATIRYDPEKAEQERKRAADRRRFDISDTDPNGLVTVDALMDTADGHDLDQAIRRRAELLGQLGDDTSLDVRRSKAAAELARHDLGQDLVLDLVTTPDDPTSGTAPVVEVRGTSATSLETTHAPGRKVTLNIHLTDQALTGTALTGTALTGMNPVGRWDEGLCPISTEQIKEWLQTHDTTVIVRPVIDLKECAPVDSYEIPDRHRARVVLRDHSCRFPHCPKPAVRCDLDHRVEHAKGGATCPCNLVPLCRRHHRAKTFSHWRYAIIQPGHYLWLSPNNHHWHVGPTGTRALDPPRRLDPDDHDEP